MRKNEINPKKRLPNFSNVEKMKLIELIEREKNIIENKKTDNVSVKDKDACWKTIAQEFNSDSISGYRDVACLKNCWDNVKKKTRKHYAEIRKEVFKTGGGKVNVIDDPIAERVKNIIQPSVEGLQNEFDSDVMPGLNDPQYSKQLEDNDDFYQVEFLEEEQSDAISWAEWTPAKLSSKKSVELQSKNSDNVEPLSMEDVEMVLAQSSKENCNPAIISPVVTNISSGRNVKHKKPKRLVNATERNERYYDLAQSKLELVEILKEQNNKKTALEIAILEMQLEKEKLHVEVLKKQLNSYEKR